MAQAVKNILTATEYRHFVFLNPGLRVDLGKIRISLTVFIAAYRHQLICFLPCLVLQQRQAVGENLSQTAIKTVTISHPPPSIQY